MVQLTKYDSVILKGIGIILLLFHNFFHNLEGAARENEFIFQIENAHYFITKLLTYPHDSIATLFSFLGHYGVALFVVLSGYGLTKKYGNEKIKRGTSIYSLVLKFWKITIPISIMLIVIHVLKLLMASNLGEFNKSFLLDIFVVNSFISNFIPGKEMLISGPWWYMSMIIQLYILFPLLRKLSNKKLLLFSMSIILFEIILVGLDFDSVIFRIKLNSVGWIPEFCLGIYMARKGLAAIDSLFVIAIIIFVGGCFNEYIWLFSGISFVFIMLKLYEMWTIRFNKQRYGFIYFMGNYSLYLFLFNSFVRPDSLIKWANTTLFLAYIASILYFVVLIIIAFVFKKVNDILFKKISLGISSKRDTPHSKNCQKGEDTI